jgi:hypothetical protein
MSQQSNCWWCQKAYNSEFNSSGFCSEKCRSEGGGLRDARESIAIREAIKERERLEKERVKNLPENLARVAHEEAKWKKYMADHESHKPIFFTIVATTIGVGIAMHSIQGVFVCIYGIYWLLYGRYLYKYDRSNTQFFEKIAIPYCLFIVGMFMFGGMFGGNYFIAGLLVWGGFLVVIII